MSDVSPRRRMLGRLLLVGGALALPLTASFSYAAAQDQPPPPADVAPSEAPPAPPAPPLPPDVPQAPQAPQAERHVQRIILKHPGDGPAVAGDLGPGEHHTFVMRVDGPMSKGQRKHFEQMQKEWEKKGAEWQKKAGEWQKMAAGQQRFALALADNVPDVSNDCDKTEGSASRSWTDNDGHQHIVICERIVRDQARMAEHMSLNGMDHARMGLRQARDAIAGNDEMSDSVKREVLADLDREIARLDAEH